MVIQSNCYETSRPYCRQLLCSQSIIVSNKKVDTVGSKPGDIYEKYTFDGKINDKEYPASLMYDWAVGAYAFASDYLMKQK